MRFTENTIVITTTPCDQTTMYADPDKTQPLSMSELNDGTNRPQSGAVNQVIKLANMGVTPTNGQRSSTELPPSPSLIDPLIMLIVKHLNNPYKWVGLLGVIIAIGWAIWHIVGAFV